jgi:GTP-binding protein Era
MKELATEKETFPIQKILVINKMDMVFNRRKLRWLITEIEDLAHF